MPPIAGMNNGSWGAPAVVRHFCPLQPPQLDPGRLESDPAMPARTGRLNRRDQGSGEAGLVKERTGKDTAAPWAG